VVTNSLNPAARLHSPLRLECIGGPALEDLTITGASIIGKGDAADIRLPHPSVSRHHAAFDYAGTGGAEGWFITDLHSRNGTFLNGRALKGSERIPLVHGDQLRITPWVFRVSLTDVPLATLARTTDDAASAAALLERLTTRAAPAAPAVAPATLRGLMSASAAIHAAPDESALWSALVSAAIRLTGFERGALLRFGSSLEHVEPQATLDTRARGGAFEFSRTLIRAAQQGSPVHLRSREIGAGETGVRGGASPPASSIASLGISSALCIPLSLDGAVCRALYLDTRGRGGARGGGGAGGGSAPQPDDVADIGQTLAEMASLALANLLRRDLDRRLAALQRDAELAFEAQRLLLPPPRGEVGSIQYALHFCPGRIVSGDLFGIVPLDAGRVGVYLGDVTGKGLRAGLIMAVIQGYLDAALQRRGEPAAALNDLAQYMAGGDGGGEGGGGGGGGGGVRRLPEGCFVSLWVGIIDPHRGELSIADAGHGMAILADDAGARLIQGGQGGAPGGGGPWLGAADVPYTSIVLPVSLAPPNRLILISDGLVEQPSATTIRSEASPAPDVPPYAQFGLERTLRILGDAKTQPRPPGPPLPHADVAALAAAVHEFAGTADFRDDLTIASIQLLGRGG
jgi:phosphoserine phosphatase RsbU/P